MLLYDNLEDVKGKLLSTYVMFKGTTAYVKDVKTKGGNKYILYLQRSGTNEVVPVQLNDPDLNYTRYNLGYANYHGCAVWWTRQPIKQWQQGLKQGQLKWYCSKANMDFNPSIGFNLATFSMLENNYPKLPTVLDLVKGTENSMAFHRDFAVSWDKMHSDFILAHKGRDVAHFKNLEEIELLDEFSYLFESIKEAV